MNVSELSERAYARLRSWGEAIVTDFISEDPKLGALEHYIHEITHALLLGHETLDDGTPQRVSSELDDLVEREQLMQEAQTWAVEWHVWQVLALPFEWLDLTAAADIQNVKAWQVEEWLDEPKTKSTAKAVLAHLQTLEAA